MKLKSTLLASALLPVTAFLISAATELTPEQAAAVKPLDRVVITGCFNVIGEAVKAVSRHVGKEGAASFYVVDTSDLGNSGDQRMVADLYKADTKKAEETSNRVISGIIELPKDQAILTEPFGTVTVQDFYRSQLEVNGAITGTVRAKSVYSSHIVRQIDANQGGSQRIIAFIYKEDVKKRIAQSSDVVLVDLEAERTVLTAGGEAARKIEISGVATIVSPSPEVDRFPETQLSKDGRHTITLPGGTKVEELSKATAAMMVPSDSIEFSDNYSNMTEVSYRVTKRAVKRSTKYYHIIRWWQERGNSLIVSAGLCR